MRLPLDREWAWGIVAVVVTTAVWLGDPGSTITKAREAAFEAMGQLFPRASASRSVVVIDIDRESLSRIGPWPWRRSLIADLVERAAAEAPRVVAIDILLAGEDRNGPAALAKELAAMSGRANLDLAEFEDDDRRLGEAIAKAGNVVLGIVLDDEGSDRAPPPAPFAVEGTTEGIAPRSAAGLIAPYQPLSAGAAGFGILSFHGGLLGQVASAPVFTVAAGETFPGFSLEAVRVAEKASLIVLRNDPNRVAIGAIETPFDSNAEMRLHFSSRKSWADRTIPAWEVLGGSGDFGPRLADKLVLIGSSAPEAGAFLPIAGAALAPTVQIQAEAIDQILTASFLSRPGFVVWWEALAMLAVGLLAVAVAVQLSPAWTVLSAFGIAVCWLAAVATAFRIYGLLIDPIGPTAAAMLAANVTEFAAFVRTRALKTAIQRRFERYVPPQVVARLVREPETLRLDGELREVTALLTDIEDFSTMTEKSDPRMLVKVLDDYFDRVTELIVSHGGMVDKMFGDAVLCFFNIPTDLPGHTEAALRCARAIVASTEQFRRRSEVAALGFGRTRCGIETGMAIVGDVGGRRRLDYTVYGPVVNKAARFQEASKVLKSTICVGPAAASALRSVVSLRPLGRIDVRGMEGFAEVFEPWEEDVPLDIRKSYDEAVAIHEGEPDRARRILTDLAARRPEDQVVKMWLGRLAG
jgi:adenylate cyclase